MVKESKTKQSTKEHVEKKRKHMLKKQVGVGSAATQDDATAALSNNVVAKDHVAGNKEDTEPPVETDIELEQQRMMNRVFDCPNLYSAAGPFTTVVQMVPVMVANHQTGGYFVVHLPVQPLQEHVAQPQHVFHPQPSDSPFSSSSTYSSSSPPSSDDGFVDGSDLESETGSLVEMVDDIKLDVSLDSSMELTDEESDYYEILDEDLERVVRS